MAVSNDSAASAASRSRFIGDLLIDYNVVRMVSMDETTPATAAWWQLQRAFFTLWLTLGRALLLLGVTVAQAEALLALQAAAAASAALPTVACLARTLGLELRGMSSLADELERRG